MTEARRNQELPASAKAARREIRWDAVAAIIATLVAFLALLVAGYTAYIQRYTAEIQTKQVQAQVWPWLVAGNNDNENSIEVINKGVGPVIVQSAQIFVDGKPQLDCPCHPQPASLWPHPCHALWPGIQGSLPETPVSSYFHP